MTYCVECGKKIGFFTKHRDLSNGGILCLRCYELYENRQKKYEEYKKDEEKKSFQEPKNEIEQESPVIQQKEGPERETKEVTIDEYNWKDEIYDIVNHIEKDEFTLKDVFGFEDKLKSKFPDNHNIKAKIRQQLQIIRDEGIIDFIGPGKYKKIDQKEEEKKIVEFEHIISGAEYNFGYLSLKDEGGKSYGNFFPPDRTKVTIIDNKGHEFSSIRRGKYQLYRDIILFFKRNQIVPGNQISIRYDPDEKARDGSSVIRVETKSILIHQSEEIGEETLEEFEKKKETIELKVTDAVKKYDQYSIYIPNKNRRINLTIYNVTHPDLATQNMIDEMIQRLDQRDVEKDRMEDGLEKENIELKESHKTEEKVNMENLIEDDNDLEIKTYHKSDKENNKIAIEFPLLESGEILTNLDICTIFKCSPQGGMRRSIKTNSLILISDQTKSIYKDFWKNDEFHYSGMGQKGNQSISFAQNKTLYDYHENDVNVYLFMVFEPKKYTYFGQIKLSGTPYKQRQSDITGNIREVWMFPLKLKDESSFKKLKKILDSFKNGKQTDDSISVIELNKANIVERYGFNNHSIFIKDTREIIDLKLFDVKHPNLETQKMIDEITSEARGIEKERDIKDILKLKEDVAKTLLIINSDQISSTLIKKVKCLLNIINLYIEDKYISTTPSIAELKKILNSNQGNILEYLEVDLKNLYPNMRHSLQKNRIDLEIKKLKNLHHYYVKEIKYQEDKYFGETEDQIRKGHVFTIYKLSLLDGFFRFCYDHGKISKSDFVKFKKSIFRDGAIKHPRVRGRNFGQLAEGLGFVYEQTGTYFLTDKGIEYAQIIKEKGYSHNIKDEDSWDVNEKQAKILRDSIFAYPIKNQIIFPIVKMAELINSGLQDEQLKLTFRDEIGKTDEWKSKITITDFSKFIINYLTEMRILDENGKITDMGKKCIESDEFGEEKDVEPEEFTVQLKKEIKVEREIKEEDERWDEAQKPIDQPEEEEKEEFDVHGRRVFRLDANDDIVQCVDDSIYVKNTKQTINCRENKVYHPDPEYQNLIDDIEAGKAYSIENGTDTDFDTDGHTSEDELEELEESSEPTTDDMGRKIIQLEQDDEVAVYGKNCMYILNKGLTINLKYFKLKHPNELIQGLINEHEESIQESEKHEDVPEEIEDTDEPEWKEKARELLDKVKAKNINSKNNIKESTSKLGDGIPIVDGSTPITAHDIKRKESRKWGKDN